VQHDAAHELHVEVAHVQRALRRFAADGERFRQQVVERLLQIGLCRFHRSVIARNFLLAGVKRLDDRPQPLAKLDGFLAQLIVGHSRNFRLERIDVRDGRKHALDIALVLRAKNRSQYFVDHHFSFA